MSRRRDIARAKREERERYPLIYTGPNTAWGLMNGVRCRYGPKGKGRGAAGARMIETSAGRKFLVPKSQLKPANQ